MAFSSHYSMIFVLQLLVLLTNDHFARTNGASLVAGVCRQTKSESVCIRAFNTDSRSKTANIKLLAQIAVDTVYTDALSTKTKIHSFIMSARNPKLKSLYYVCENLYVDALNGLAAAEDDMANGRFVDLKTKAKLVGDAGTGCEAAFNNKSQFKSANLKLEVLGQAITVIANEISN